jgi:Fe-S cluster biosynthesis and repair protein YggX
MARFQQSIPFKSSQFLQYSTPVRLKGDLRQGFQSLLQSRLCPIHARNFMARTVHCIKLEKEAEGLDFPPYPGDLGKRIWENVSKEAWAAWLKHQTMLVNENRLNLADLRARQYLARQMENHFFGDGADAAQGYVPPPAA